MALAAAGYRSTVVRHVAISGDDAADRPHGRVPVRLPSVRRGRSPVEHDRRADRIRAGHAFAAPDSGAGRRYDADHHTRLHEAADHVHHRHDADRVRRDADASVRHDRPLEPALGLQWLMAVDGTVRLDRFDPLPGGAHPLRGRGAMVARRLHVRRQFHAHDSGNPAARRLAACGVLCGAYGDANHRAAMA